MSQEMLKSIIGFRFYCYCHHCWTTSKFCLKIFCCFLLWNSLNKPSTSGRPRLKPQPRKVEEGSASFWVLLCAVFITGFFSPRLSSIPGQLKKKQQGKTFPVFKCLVCSSDHSAILYCLIYPVILIATELLGCSISSHWILKTTPRTKVRLYSFLIHEEMQESNSHFFWSVI